MSETIICQICQFENSSEYNHCVNCGNPLVKYPPTQNSEIANTDVPNLDKKSSFPSIHQLLPEPNNTHSENQVPPSTPMSSDEPPCLIKALGGFYGCLFGLIVGLLVSLICILPVGLLISGNDPEAGLTIAIILITIVVIGMTLFGIVKGPSFLTKLLKAIADVFRWLFKLK